MREVIERRRIIYMCVLQYVYTVTLFTPIRRMQGNAAPWHT